MADIRATNHYLPVGRGTPAYHTGRHGQSPAIQLPRILAWQTCYRVSDSSWYLSRSALPFQAPIRQTNVDPTGYKRFGMRAIPPHPFGWGLLAQSVDLLKFSQELLDNLILIREFFWKPTFIRFFIQNRTLLGHDSYIPNITGGSVRDSQPCCGLRTRSDQMIWQDRRLRVYSCLHHRQPPYRVLAVGSACQKARNRSAETQSGCSGGGYGMTIEV